MPQCEADFKQLKELLTSSSVLAFLDFDVPFLLETDASLQEPGAVLSQAQSDEVVRPIAYASQCLQSHERNYGITELEGLGVVRAVKHFRPYLYGHHCDIYTDHEGLKLLHVEHSTTIRKASKMGDGYSGIEYVYCIALGRAMLNKCGCFVMGTCQGNR